jgi:hypothetical protein
LEWVKNEESEVSGVEAIGFRNSMVAVAKANWEA